MGVVHGVHFRVIYSSSRVISTRLVVFARLFLHLVAGWWTARRKERKKEGGGGVLWVDLIANSMILR